MSGLLKRRWSAKVWTAEDGGQLMSGLLKMVVS